MIKDIHFLLHKKKHVITNSFVYWKQYLELHFIGFLTYGQIVRIEIVKFIFILFIHFHQEVHFKGINFLSKRWSGSENISFSWYISSLWYICTLFSVFRLNVDYNYARIVMHYIAALNSIFLLSTHFGRNLAFGLDDLSDLCLWIDRTLISGAPDTIRRPIQIQRSRLERPANLALAI